MNDSSIQKPFYQSKKFLFASGASCVVGTCVGSVLYASGNMSTEKAVYTGVLVGLMTIATYETPRLQKRNLKSVNASHNDLKLAILKNNLKRHYDLLDTQERAQFPKALYNMMHKKD